MHGFLSHKVLHLRHLTCAVAVAVHMAVYQLGHCYVVLHGHHCYSIVYWYDEATQARSLAVLDVHPVRETQ